MKSIETLIIIPARGGSKRIPRKNIVPLAGKPLICWTIETAIKSKIKARIILTSDDDEILAIAKAYKSKGVEIHKRSSQAAGDTSPTVDALIEVIRPESTGKAFPKTVILLQPTSPLRTCEDVEDAYRKYVERGGNETVVSVCQLEHPTSWTGKIDNEEYFSQLQIKEPIQSDGFQEYRLNGAVYVIPTKSILEGGKILTEKVIALKMPRERSLDIDVPFDLDIAEFLLKKGLPINEKKNEA